MGRTLCKFPICQNSPLQVEQLGINLIGVARLRACAVKLRHLHVLLDEIKVGSGPAADAPGGEFKFQGNKPSTCMFRHEGM